jgi:hypothetical protein
MFNVTVFGLDILIVTSELFSQAFIGGSLFYVLFFKVRNPCSETICERSLYLLSAVEGTVLKIEALASCCLSFWSLSKDNFDVLASFSNFSFSDCKMMTCFVAWLSLFSYAHLGVRKAFQ